MQLQLPKPRLLCPLPPLLWRNCKMSCVCWEGRPTTLAPMWSPEAQRLSDRRPRKCESNYFLPAFSRPLWALRPWLFLLHPTTMEVFFISVCGKHYEEVGARGPPAHKGWTERNTGRRNSQKAARLTEGLFVAGVFQPALQKWVLSENWLQKLLRMEAPALL